MQKASKEESEFEDAVALIYLTYPAQPQEIKKPTAMKEAFGHFFAFTQKEADELSALLDLIVRYIGQRSPARPLCLAIFGPPGSGKSFAVKQIRELAEEKVNDPKLKLPLTLVNLTQVSNSIDLGRVIARIAGEQDEDTVPIVFFDEFDASRDGAPYGWLQWFLAPMHDGEFLHEGAVIRLKRAVYVFAGGTADTMSEFSSPRSVPAFRAAKGPDFISRLRGYLDVQGPNAEYRASRRAVLLRKELQDRTTRERHKPIKPDEDLLRALLGVGRYRHGARSIAAIIELSDFRNDRFDWSALPEDHLLSLHIDRGPLDSRLIGGSIAFSGYATSGKEDDVAACWRAVARELWREGATLSYAGSWAEGAGGQLMRLLAHIVKSLPVEPSRTQERRDKPSPWLVSFLKDNPEPRQPTINGAIMDSGEQARCGLQLVTANYLTDKEVTAFAGDTWSSGVVERFRRRLAVSESSVARFAVAGATENHEGRAPGIAEELMLTLALQKPIYVAGGFGGAAMDVGSLLGLANSRTGEVPKSLQTQPNESKLGAIRDKLQPGPWTSLLPVTASEIALFLKEHAIGGPKWPDNGLSTEENRRLFELTKSAEVAKLVAQGLRHRFGAT